VFPNANSSDKLLVKGAVKPNYNLSPGSVTFKIDPYTKATESSNSQATVLALASTLAAGSALISLI
jgi:hypothetical protein